MLDLVTQKLEDKPPLLPDEKKKGLKDKPVDEVALNQAKLQHHNNVKRGED